MLEFLDERGQSGGMIKTIFVGVILAVVLGMATSQIITAMPGEQDYSLTIDGTGAENIELHSYKSVENGKITVDYDMSSADNITVKLNDTTIFDKEITGSGTLENVSATEDALQEGTNTLDVSLQNSNANSLSTTLDATVDTDVLGVLPTAESMGPTIVTFVFLGLLVLAIVGLIRYFRAV